MHVSSHLVARLIAIETTGCDSMYHSVLANDTPSHVVPSRMQLLDSNEPEYAGVKMVSMVPTSKATSLGATSSAPGIIKRFVDRRAKDRGLVTCVNLPDELAMVGCLGFTGEFEPSQLIFIIDCVLILFLASLR